ncbi:deoxyribose-phosphate aldolase [Pseudodesulfovibrio thermohalotolerans]|uniref:deoxyribose-phosphate aldolase n=1 Tax=Pseudodesulfovibrio thermohalotolerans TaxID=2880651 RepID=UPI0024433DA7|nr:deoxyribose-phosphate aldolase [Pseudodesulfovibrio thermohalotolerans]WFS62680.1 deoxyribose-phosphate aldolase [Pseudodesulfovibrio thermohalotolerans]
MNDDLKILVAEAEKARADETCALRILASMDLTSLGEDDTDEKIRALCARAVTPKGHVAAVCVYDKFVPLALRELAGTGVRVATVCNFPHGLPDAVKAVAEARAQVAAGVQEVDVVLPYKRYKAGHRDQAIALLHQVREVCGETVLLKVILETSQLQSPKIIGEASRDAIEAGADFIKTSTGKVPGGATLEAAAVMLSAIREMEPKVKRPLGFKPSGGLKTADQAAGHLFLADRILGQGWATPQTLRFGASSLLDDVKKHLGL